jgi:hypothetical protein
MSNLVKFPTNQELLISLGVLPILVHWLSLESDDDPQPQEGAAECLAVLSVHEQAACDMIKLDSFLPALESATGNFTNCDKLKL